LLPTGKLAVGSRCKIQLAGQERALASGGAREQVREASAASAPTRADATENPARTGGPASAGAGMVEVIRAAIWLPCHRIWNA